jgi:hypothetical protein
MSRRKSDGFGDVMMGGPTRARRESGSWSFLAVVAGLKSPDQWAICPKCKGSGQSGSLKMECNLCRGAGYEPTHHGDQTQRDES